MIVLKPRSRREVKAGMGQFCDHLFSPGALLLTCSVPKEGGFANPVNGWVPSPIKPILSGTCPASVGEQDGASPPESVLPPPIPSVRLILL